MTLSSPRAQNWVATYPSTRSNLWVAYLHCPYSQTETARNRALLLRAHRLFLWVFVQAVIARCWKGSWCLKRGRLKHSNCQIEYRWAIKTKINYRTVNNNKTRWKRKIPRLLSRKLLLTLKINRKKTRTQKAQSKNKTKVTAAKCMRAVVSLRMEDYPGLNA